MIYTKSKRLLFIVLVLVWVSWFLVRWEDFPYTDANGWATITNDDSNTSLEIWKIINENAVQADNSILQRLLLIFKLKWSNRYNAETWHLKAFAYVKMIVNYMLTLVSLIALILTIYGFYLMFFSGQDEWLKKAKKILTWVAIAMAIMWLSRFIISFIFWVYNTNT